MQKRTVKTLALTFFASFTTTAFATLPGPYFGLMFGPATNNGSDVLLQMENSPNTTPAHPKSNQYGSRLYAGYQLNNYFAWELGFTFFTRVDYDTRGVDTCSGASASARSIELLGKGIFNFYNYFDIYGKAGVAVVYNSKTGDFNRTYDPSKSQFCGKSNYVVSYKPTYSLGASYNITDAWLVDISWNRVMVGSPLNSFDWYALGLSYHWVDRYCGQFLCD